MSAHTPGPWAIDPDPTKSNELNGICVTRASDVGKGSWLPIAEVRGERFPPLYDDNSQAQANARLIAAAPELLKTLQRAERCISGYTASSQKECGLEAIRAVIAKATGAQS